MALMFPPAFPRRAPSASGEAAVYDALRRALGEGWRVFYDRTIVAGGEEGRIDFVLLHPERGVLLVAVAPADIEIDGAAAEGAMATMLGEQRFLDRFASLPRIAALAVPPDCGEGLAERIESALPVAAASDPGNHGWADWLAEHLARPSDQIGATAKLAPRGAAGPMRALAAVAAGAPRRRVLAYAATATLSTIFTAVPAEMPWSLTTVFRGGAEPPTAAPGDTPSRQDASLSSQPAAATAAIPPAPEAVPAPKPPVAETPHRKPSQRAHHKVHKTHHQAARQSWWDRFVISLR